LVRLIRAAAGLHEGAVVTPLGAALELPLAASEGTLALGSVPVPIEPGVVPGLASLPTERGLVTLAAGTVPFRRDLAPLVAGLAPPGAAGGETSELARDRGGLRAWEWLVLVA